MPRAALIERTDKMRGELLRALYAERRVVLPRQPVGGCPLKDSVAQPTDEQLEHKCALHAYPSLPRSRCSNSSRDISVIAYPCPL